MKHREESVHIIPPEKIAFIAYNMNFLLALLIYT
jgi:hypothetical protein